LANVEHKNLPNAELHEPKGVSAASAGQVYVADGASSGAWASQDHAFAQGYIEGNASSTTISGTGSGNEVQVSFGGAFNSALTNSFTIDTAGTFTYTGSDTVNVMVDVTIFATQGSASSVEYIFQIAKNGTVIASSVSQLETDGTNGRACSCGTLTTLNTNDTIELYVRNETNTQDITVKTCSIRVVSLEW